MSNFGDFNSTGIVDSGDLNSVLNSWGVNYDSGDLNKVLDYWGQNISHLGTNTLTMIIWQEHISDTETGVLPQNSVSDINVTINGVTSQFQINETKHTTITLPDISYPSTIKVSNTNSLESKEWKVYSIKFYDSLGRQLKTTNISASYELPAFPATHIFNDTILQYWRGQNSNFHNIECTVSFEDGSLTDDIAWNNGNYYWTSAGIGDGHPNYSGGWIQGGAGCSGIAFTNIITGLQGTSTIQIGDQVSSQVINQYSKDALYNHVNDEQSANGIIKTYGAWTSVPPSN